MPKQCMLIVFFPSFFNTNAQEKQKYLCHKVHKSTEFKSKFGGTVRTNTETDQGISTSSRFQILMDVPQEDNFTFSQDDLSSCSGTLHNSTHRLNKTRVSVHKKSKEVPKPTFLSEKCVQLPECQPCFVSKTPNDDKVKNYIQRGIKTKLAL